MPTSVLPFPKILCRNQDGEVVAVDLAAIRQSHTFENMYQDLNLAEEDFSFVFDIKAISSATFSKVHQWLVQHIDVAEPVIQRENDTKELIWFKLTEEEKKFLDLSVNELLDLITAANYLDIPTLRLYSAQTLAGMVRAKIEAKDHDGIRDMFDLPDDLTAEEKDQVKKENPWCKYE